MISRMSLSDMRHIVAMSSNIGDNVLTTHALVILRPTNEYLNNAIYLNARGGSLAKKRVRLEQVIYSIANLPNGIPRLRVIDAAET